MTYSPASTIHYRSLDKHGWAWLSTIIQRVTNSSLSKAVLYHTLTCNMHCFVLKMQTVIFSTHLNQKWNKSKTVEVFDQWQIWNLHPKRLVCLSRGELCSLSCSLWLNHSSPSVIVEKDVNLLHVKKPACCCHFSVYPFQQRFMLRCADLNI